MYNHDNVIDKLSKLQFTISTDKIEDDKEKDLLWCKRLITNVKDSGLVPDKIEFTMANLMWKKYSNHGLAANDEMIWSLIDVLLEEGSKIGAIKMYRRFVNSSLREAKEVIDAREIKNKKEW